MSVPAEIIEALEAAARPVVIGHVNPDIDALGAMLALARALPSPHAVIALPVKPTNQRLRFMFELAGGGRIADARELAEADVAVVVDTASPSRVNVPGKWEAIAHRCIVNIDHHITNGDFGRFNWVEDGASSTCEMICRLIRAAGWEMDAVTASLLFAGIYGDTAGFSLPTATAEVFETASALVRAGADVERIGARLCRSQERHEFDLVRTVYHNTRIAAEGRIAYSTLSHDEITAAGCSAEDIDEQVSIPHSLSGVKVAMLFSEGERGVIRINLRGEDGTPVLPIAARLGGGGHRYSAGVRVRGEMNAVVERVLAEAATCLESLSA